MIYLLLLLVAPLCAAVAYTMWRARQTSRLFKPDGSLVTVDGVRLHYHFFAAGEGRPEKPVLVFLHGASGNACDAMLAFLERFRGQYPLLFVDRPGLGFSERSGSGQDTPEGQARLIAGLLAVLEIRSAMVIGHSYGGAVAAALGLAARDRVKGLAFLAPVSHPWPGGVSWYYTVAALPVIGKLFCWTLTLPIAERLAPAAIANVFHPDRPPEGYAEAIKLPRLFRPDVFGANARDIATLRRAVAVQSKQYPSLKQPALIVTGTDDTVVWPSIHCEGLLKDLPNAELLVLNGAGHMPHHTHTEEIATALERLVCRVVGAAGDDALSATPERKSVPA